MTMAGSIRNFPLNDSSKLTDILSKMWRKDADISRHDIPFLLRLLWHRDAAVRQEAIRVAALHWHIPEALPHLLSIYSFAESDQRLRKSASVALGSFPLLDTSSVREVQSALAAVTLDKSLDIELRAQSYADLCHVSRASSTQEYDLLPSSFKDLTISDASDAWLKGFLLPASQSLGKLLSFDRSLALDLIRKAALHDGSGAITLSDEIGALLTHTDTDIRAKAIEILGLRWRSPNYFFRFVHAATRVEDDVETCQVLISSMAALVDGGAGRLIDVVVFFVETALNESIDPQKRKFAYYDVLKIAGYLDAEKYAFDASWAFVDSLKIDQEKLLEIIDKSA